MPETFTTKKLAQGQCTTSYVNVYTVPSLTKAVLTSIVFTNTNTTTGRNVTCRVGAGAGPVQILSARLLAAGESICLQFNVALAAADLVQVLQSAGADVDYVISGVEIT
jgi:hypothetical protein